MSLADVAEVPPGVVTVMSTLPTAWAGAVAVICVAELTVKLLAAVPPKDTAVTAVKLLPVMTTDVPPDNGPSLTLSEETTGTASKVNLSLADVAEVPPGLVTVTSTLPAA